jgi:putative oxidoreductase
MATVTSDVARLVVRLGVGGILAFDGYQKVMAWYRGRQTAVTAVAAASAGSTVQEPAGTSTPAGRTVSLTAGISEAVGGAMLVLGIATPATGAAAASSMALTATADASSDRFGGGYEIPAVLGICAGALAIVCPTGPPLSPPCSRRWGRPVSRSCVATDRAVRSSRAAAVLASGRANPAPARPARSWQQSQPKC